MTSDPIRRRAFTRLALTASAASLWPTLACANNPTIKGLNLVVPTPPGSQPDTIARWLAMPLATRSELAVQVLNVPGAAGALAADAVLQAPAERGSLLLGGLDHVAYSHLNSNRRALDPFTDFTPVAAVNRDSWVIATSSESPTRSMSALADRARREPLSYASNGEGSTSHLLSARLCRAMSIDAQHVPYRDPWMPDLIAGRIHFVVAPTAGVLPQVRAGRLQLLASLTDEPLPLPGPPPTLRALGVDNQVFHGGLFLFAPAPLAALAPRLNGWISEVLDSPDIARRYREAAIEPTPVGLAETHRMIHERLRTLDAMRMAVFGRAR